MKKNILPIKVSARHIHLSQQDLEQLFGLGFKLSKKRTIDQPGQFASKEKVTIKGPKGLIENITIVGPVREKTQVEISKTDAINLGIDPPVERSTINPADQPAKVTVIGPEQSISSNSAIIAQRHIHTNSQQAQKYQLKDGQFVKVKIAGKRGLIFDNVLVRVSDQYSLGMHIDTDEANAAGVFKKTEGEIVN